MVTYNNTEMLVPYSLQISKIFKLREANGLFLNEGRKEYSRSRHLNVHFQGEEGIDVGGITRECTNHY